MTKNSVTAFSRRASIARMKIFGESATWKGMEITIATNRRLQKELESGGFEQAGELRVLTLQQGIALHDEILFGGKKYRVTEVVTQTHTPEVSLTITCRP